MLSNRFLLLSLLLPVVLPTVTIAQSPSASASIHDVEWLAGCWEMVTSWLYRSGDRVSCGAYSRISDVLQHIVSASRQLYCRGRRTACRRR